MDGVRSGVGDEQVGERDPARRLFPARSAPGDLAQAGGADQATVGPGVRLDLPNPGVGVGLAPAQLDCMDRGLDGPPAVGVEVVVAGRGGEQQQRFAEGVELELLVDREYRNWLAVEPSGPVATASNCGAAAVAA
jgi:hypothetical protein